ncbi:hypothetical protein H0H92_012391 [Tricholoma furcatifolium]|nr:hypothetical protein H0H92_012391 [Tricholoma furcatifolium]
MARARTPPPQLGYLKEGDRCKLNRTVTVQLMFQGIEPYLPHIEQRVTLGIGHPVIIDGGPRSMIMTGDNSPADPATVRYRFRAKFDLEVYENSGVAIDPETRLVRHANLKPVLSTAEAVTRGFAFGDIVSLTKTASSLDKCTYLQSGQLLRITSPYPVSPSEGLDVRLKPKLLQTGVYAASKVTKITKRFEVYNLDLLARDDLTLEE